jgi:hypothetical protein
MSHEGVTLIGRAAIGVLQVFESDRDRAVAELRRMELKIVKP